MCVRNFKLGIYTGLAGGVVFGAIMATMGMLPMIGKTIREAVQTIQAAASPPRTYPLVVVPYLNADQVDELGSGRVLELDVHWLSLSRRLENRLSKKLDDCFLVGGHLSERVESSPVSMLDLFPTCAEAVVVDRPPPPVCCTR